MQMFEKEMLLKLETLIKRGYEFHAWVVVEKSPIHAGCIGVVINDPEDLPFNEVEMGDSVYAPTLKDALEKALRRLK